MVLPFKDYDMDMFIYGLSEWKHSEVVTLLDQIQSVMTNDDNIKYSTMVDKLEWDKVKVGDHTAAECKDQWISITTKVQTVTYCYQLNVNIHTYVWTAPSKSTDRLSMLSPVRELVSV